MAFLLYTIHIIVCIFLILVVLLQQGKGADLSVFGGGATMTAFGARGAATVLHKLTVWGFVGFILTTLTIGVLQSRSGQSTVMSDVPAVEETTEAATSTPASEPAEPVATDNATAPDSEAAASGAMEGEAVEDGAAVEEEPVETPVAEGES